MPLKFDDQLYNFMNPFKDNEKCDYSTKIGVIEKINLIA